MFERCVRFVSFVLLLTLVSSPAFAQSTSASSLSGVVVDSDGGAIPGATVVVKNNATGVTAEAVSNTSGQFSFPSLDAGTYTVTVSLTGFKTFVASDVRLLTARPGSVTAKLEIGSLSETIEVKASTELVQTQTPAVTTTLSTEVLSELPLVSRNALYSVAMLPGVATTGGPRGSIINGLPNNSVNITIDGVGAGNMLQSTDGFFSMVSPRMDAVEEITVTGAVPGVGAGAGSTQIAFTTRSGSNQFDGSIYHYWRDPRFNSNYYFNKVNGLEKNEVTVHQYGGRIGGPIVLPGYNGRGKAFFFFNLENLYQPSSVSRTRQILNATARQGIFTYDRTVNGVTTQQQVNLLSLAAANGQISTTDPTVMSILQRIHEITQTTGAVNDTPSRNTQNYAVQFTGKIIQYSPTGRIDYNITDKHRLSATYYWQRFLNNNDFLNSAEPRFPGMPNNGEQNSYRTTGSIGLRSTLSSNLVNELKAGLQWSPNDFFTNVTPSMFEDQGGYALSFPNMNGNTTLHSASTVINSAPRNTTTWSVSNDLSWLKGAHSITFGGSFNGTHNRQNSYDAVSNPVLGFDATNDPAAAMFNATNFPGASNNQLTDARALYGLLTGRVTSIAGTARLDAETGKYVYLGDLTQKSKQYGMAAYVSDSWRVTPTLTLTGGVRWDVQFPFTAVTPTFSTSTMEDLCGISGLGNGVGGRACNLFKPGNLTGKAVPQYQQFTPGMKTHNTNWTDFGYNVGFAWRPNVQDGMLRTILGSPDQATIRGGYSMTYNVERFDRFVNSVGANPGGSISATRNTTGGYCLVCAGESFPILFRQRERMGAPAFPETPVYPLNATTAQSIQIFQPEMRTPRVHSYSVGFQRSIGADMALEVRYVGNKSMYAWAEEAWNERTIFENGFYDEFKLAQANLKANIAGGKGATFAYTGIPGTSPLPIHQAYLSGRSGTGVTNPAMYTATQYTNTAFLARFSDFEPGVANAAQAIDTTAFRANALAAGLPANFFVLNPAAGGAQVVTDRDGSRYNSLQVELRRRLAQGLLASASYTYGIRKTLIDETIRLDRFEVDNTAVPHEFKMQWTYELPIGRGRRFGTDMNPILNGLLGNWEFSGNARLQTQRYRITDAKLVGMTTEELQKEFKIRTFKDAATGVTSVFSMPQDIIDNTRRAYNTDPTTTTGYSSLGVPTGRYIRPSSGEGCISIYRGDCNAPDINLNGPMFTRVDLRVKKAFPFLSRANVELTLEMLNAFNNINFNHQLNPGEGATIFQVTSAYTDINTTFDPGGRIGQVVWRINW